MITKIRTEERILLMLTFFGFGGVFALMISSTTTADASKLFEFAAIAGIIGMLFYFITDLKGEKRT